jgi:hypothetical protein
MAAQHTAFNIQPLPPSYTPVHTPASAALPPYRASLSVVALSCCLFLRLISSITRCRRDSQGGGGVDQVVRPRGCVSLTCRCALSEGHTEKYTRDSTVMMTMTNRKTLYRHSTVMPCARAATAPAHDATHTTPHPTGVWRSPACT